MKTNSDFLIDLSPSLCWLDFCQANFHAWTDPVPTSLRTDIRRDGMKSFRFTHYVAMCQHNQRRLFVAFPFTPMRQLCI